MFGFSVNFAMAIIARFFIGFFNGKHNPNHYSMYLVHICSAGTVSTSKAVLSEVSDDSNQAFGLTILGTAWGIGYIIGPAISGVLADPIGQYNLTITSTFSRTTTTLTCLFFRLFPWLLDSFLHAYFSQFPYSIPSIVNFFLFIITLVATFFLPETLGVKK